MAKKGRATGIRERTGRWEIRFMVKGRVYQRITGLEATRQNLDAAQRMLLDWRKGVLLGKVVGTERITFREMSERFLAWSEMTHRAHPATWKRHRTSLASLKAFFDLRLVDTIGPGDLDDFMTWRAEAGIKDVTIRHDMHALSQVFQYAQRHGWREDNPVRLVAIPSDMESRNEIVVSDGDERRYLAEATNHQTLFDIARLMLMQGMRPQELLGLRKSLVNLDAQTLRIASGKSRSARRILNLTGESCVILGRRMDGESKWVFPSRRKVWHRRRKQFFWVTVDAKPLTYSGLVKAHDQACQAAGLEFTLYSLRHTFATRFYRRTRDLEALRRVLGHGDLKTVLRYVHIDQEDLKRAMQKFEEGMVRRVEVIQ